MRSSRLILLFLLLATTAGAERKYEPSTLVYPTFKHDLGMHHVNSTHLRFFTGNRHRFVSPRGLCAVKLRERDNPGSTTDDDELTIYGVNSGEHMIIYNTSMYGLNVYGGKGSGPGQLLFPRGIAADPEGNVFVADTGNNRVVQLRYRRGKLRELRHFGGSAGKPVPLRAPRGVALATDGTLFVTDTANNRIVAIDRTGRVRRILDAEGLFSGPDAIAVLDEDERWSFRPASFLLVIDRNGQRIQKLTFDGRPLRSLSTKDLGLEKGRFRGVAIDYYHQIYITDEANHQLHKLNSNLKPIVSFGREGDGNMEFRSPYDITIWRRFGQVFVSESSGAQYYWIGVDIVDYHVEPLVFRAKGKIVFTNTERAQVTVSVRGTKGRVVRTLADNRVFPAGEQRLAWDGTDDRGDRLPSGRYQIRIEARATYSSSKYFQKEVEFPVTLG